MNLKTKNIIIIIIVLCISSNMYASFIPDRYSEKLQNWSMVQNSHYLMQGNPAQKALVINEILEGKIAQSKGLPGFSMVESFSTILVMVIAANFLYCDDVSDYVRLNSIERNRLSMSEMFDFVMDSLKTQGADLEFFSMFLGAAAIETSISYGLSKTGNMALGAENIRMASHQWNVFFNAGIGQNMFAQFISGYIHILYAFGWWEIIGEWLDISKHLTKDELRIFDPKINNDSGAVFSDDYLDNIYNLRDIFMLNKIEQNSPETIKNLAILVSIGWASLIARIYGELPTICARCGKEMKLKKFILKEEETTAIVPWSKRAPPKIKFPKFDEVSENIEYVYDKYQEAIN
ncbi:MAG: hypothetical protein ABIA04_07580 [Pseudomonadota bacterium]